MFEGFLVANWTCKEHGNPKIHHPVAGTASLQERRKGRSGQATKANPRDALPFPHSSRRAKAAVHAAA